MSKVIIAKSTDTNWDSSKSSVCLTVFDEDATDEIIENELSRFQSGELVIEGFENPVIIDRSTIPDNDHYFFNAWVIDSNNNVTVDLSRAKQVAKFRIKEGLKSYISKWYADQVFGDISSSYITDTVSTYTSLCSDIDADTDFATLKQRIKNFLLSYTPDELSPVGNEMY